MAQASVLLLFQHAETLSRGQVLVYMCKVDHNTLSRKFSGMEMALIINVRYGSKIFGSWVHKVGSELDFWQSFKIIHVTHSILYCPDN